MLKWKASNRLTRRVARLAAGAALVSALAVVGAQPVAAAGSLLPGGPKLADKSTAVAGDTINYIIPYFCSSTIPGDNCNGMTITDMLPTFIDVFGVQRPLVVVAATGNSHFSAATLSDRLVWTADNLIAGDSGAVTATMRVPNGLVGPSGATITNTASFNSNGVIVEAQPAVTTIAAATPNVIVTKSNDRTQILVDGNTTYTISVCPAPGGSHYPGGYAVIDGLPAGAEVVQPIAGGGVEGPTGTVSWSIANSLDSGFDAVTGCFTERLRVHYPSGLFPVGSTVTNSVTVDPGGPEPALGAASDGDTIRAPQPGMTLAKWTDSGNAVKDADPVNFMIWTANSDAEGNAGETPLDNLTIVDGPLPVGFDLTSVMPGQWVGGFSATIEVSDDGPSGPWTPIGTADGSAAQHVALAVPVSVGGASDGSGRYVRWSFAAELPEDFAFANPGQVQGSATAAPFLPEPGLPQTIDNCVSSSADATVQGETSTIVRGPACAAFTMQDAQPIGSIDKSVDTTLMQPGDVGTFTIASGNDLDATAPMVISATSPAMLQDCMPAFLVVDAITLNGWRDVSPGSLSCDAGETPLVFVYEVPTTLTAALELPSVEIDVHVSEFSDPQGAAPPGDIVNTATFSHPDVASCTQPSCADSATVTVSVSSTLKSRMQIQGFYDPAMTGPVVPYTDSSVDISADTYPGGPINFRIAVLNNGNADVRNFVIVGILPAEGDTGVKVASQLRYSQFRPTLEEPISAPAGWLVEYSASTQPCRDEIAPVALTSCEAPNWTSDLQSLAVAGSYRLTLVGTGPAFEPALTTIQLDDAVFERGEEIVVDFAMVAPLYDDSYDLNGTTAFPWEGLNPASQIDIDPSSQDSCADLNSPGDQPTTTGDRCPVARSSFAYAGIAFSPSNQFGEVGLGSEPPRVDVTVYAPPSNAVGDLVWEDLNANGLQEPDEPGIGGVTVALLNADRTASLDEDGAPRTTTTASDGTYSFVNLPDGDYRVRFVPPSGYLVSPANASGDPAGSDVGGATLDGSPNTGNDSDAPTPTAGASFTDTAVIHLAQQDGVGEFDPTWDLGIHRLAAPATSSLGDTVWHDVNGNGRQATDNSEPGVDGVTVRLFDAGGTLVATTTTAGGGKYLFSGLVPGAQYSVEFVISTLPAGFIATVANNGDEALDSDGDRSTGRSALYIAPQGGANLDVDFGIHQPNIDLQVSKAAQGVGSAGLSAGSEVTWAINVVNNGADVETSMITVTDQLPATLSFISASGDGWTCSASGQDVRCETQADLAPGASASTLRVVTRLSATAAGEIVNVVLVASANSEVTTSNNRSTATLTSTPQWLPATGSNAGPLVVLAAGSLISGVVLRRLARRRSSASAM